MSKRVSSSLGLGATDEKQEEPEFYTRKLRKRKSASNVASGFKNALDSLTTKMKRPSTRRCRRLVYTSPYRSPRTPRTVAKQRLISVAPDSTPRGSSFHAYRIDPKAGVTPQTPPDTDLRRSLRIANQSPATPALGAANQKRTGIRPGGKEGSDENRQSLDSSIQGVTARLMGNDELGGLAEGMRHLGDISNQFRRAIAHQDSKTDLEELVAGAEDEGGPPEMQELPKLEESRQMQRVLSFYESKRKRAAEEDPISDKKFLTQAVFSEDSENLI